MLVATLISVKKKTSKAVKGLGWRGLEPGSGQKPRKEPGSGQELGFLPSPRFLSQLWLLSRLLSRLLLQLLPLLLSELLLWPAASAPAPTLARLHPSTAPVSAQVSPAPSSPVQLCPEPCSSPATYHACLLQAMLQPSPPPANTPAVLQPSPASLLPCSSPIPALLRPWPGLSLIQSNLLQPSPAYSSPAPIPPSPKFQYLPVEVPCSSLPAPLESLPTMPQLIRWGDGCRHEKAAPDDKQTRRGVPLLLRGEGNGVTWSKRRRSWWGSWTRTHVAGIKHSETGGKWTGDDPGSLQ